MPNRAEKEIDFQRNAQQTCTHPPIPIKLFQNVFCQHCDSKCNPKGMLFLNCVLCLIADELAKQRQIMQYHAQSQRR